jgi:hypothetical protein
MPSNPPVGGVVLTKITLEDEYVLNRDEKYEVSAPKLSRRLAIRKY